MVTFDQFAFCNSANFAVLAMTGCKKFSQDVETIETSSIGGGSGGAGSGGSGDDGGEDYTDDLVPIIISARLQATNAISGCSWAKKHGAMAHDSLLDAHAENAISLHRLPAAIPRAKSRRWGGPEKMSKRRA